MTPLVLGALALVLAGPVPGLLTRLPRLRRTPASTLVLWQALALGAVLAALGAGLTLAVDETWRRQPGPAAYAVATVALLVTGLVVGRLLLSGHVVGTELRDLRRRHRDRIDLVGRRVADGSVRLVDHPLPVAYCLPGMRGARIVLSSGAVDRLAPGQLAAVLGHERAHLRGRHDLVLEAFTVLRRAFPRGVSSTRALAEVSLLVEVLADRAVVREGRARELVEALLAMSESRDGSAAGPAVPGGALGSAEVGLGARAALLADGSSHRWQAAVVGALAAAVLWLPAALVVWPWARDTLL